MSPTRARKAILACCSLPFLARFGLLLTGAATIGARIAQSLPGVPRLPERRQFSGIERGVPGVAAPIGDTQACAARAIRWWRRTIRSSIIRSHCCRERYESPLGCNQRLSQLGLEPCFKTPAQTVLRSDDDLPRCARSGCRRNQRHVRARHLINHGWKTASKCRGLLSEVHTETRLGAYEPAPLFKNPVELHWAHEPLDCFAKDIPPHKPTRLDVCYAHEGYPMLHFFCEKLPRGVQTNFPPGRYKIRIRVRSKDGATCSRRFLVAYDGNFRNVYLEQLVG